MSKNKKDNVEKFSEIKHQNKDKTFQQGRRNMIKALAGIPVLGLLGLEVFKKTNYDRSHNKNLEIRNNLGLSDIQTKAKRVHVVSDSNIIRIGIIGFGRRGTSLAHALGFMNKHEFYRSKDDEKLVVQAKSGNLNVVLAGVCDVYDLHAEKGLVAADFDIYTEGKLAKRFPAKRYMHYHDMLNDKNIDAVIIATPTHHHARMTIDAIKAGKHVYCENAPVRREKEVYELYDVVKNSKLVYQLGHQMTHNAIFQQAREIISKNLLGKISHIETSTNRNTPQEAWVNHFNINGNPKPGDEISIDWQQWLGDSQYVPFSLKRYYNWPRYFDYDTGLFGQLFSPEYNTLNQLLNLGIPKYVVATGGQYFYTEFGDIPDVLNTAFEYPDKGLMITYNANLASSRKRDLTIYGQDASMTLGGDMMLTPDANSKRYSQMLKNGLINPSTPMFTIKSETENEGIVDAVSSATSLHYASKDLSTTSINGQVWDVTYLHLKEWIDCIKDTGIPSANIDKAFSEGITIVMADISYREKCRTEWDEENKKIIKK